MLRLKFVISLIVNRILLLYFNFLKIKYKPYENPFLPTLNAQDISQLRCSHYLQRIQAECQGVR